MRPRFIAACVVMLVGVPTLAQDDQTELSYAAITARHPSAQLNARELAAARADGECLAGIKMINSLPNDEFQPNIEWLNIRTQALLTLARPCEVLIMLEVAHDALGTSNAPGHVD